MLNKKKPKAYIAIQVLHRLPDEIIKPISLDEFWKTFEETFKSLKPRARKAIVKLTNTGDFVEGVQERRP